SPPIAILPLANEKAQLSLDFFDRLKSRLPMEPGLFHFWDFSPLFLTRPYSRMRKAIQNRTAQMMFIGKRNSGGGS
ncbi:hypothetical protein, partial [uncultured Intestinimonas sp.]|uniref:hypothetical protein n=1 Tax=uncultured Intestinimonas sp. TaxID=1689265 RepID=UPI0025ED2553